MILIETVLGNIGDPEWSGRLSTADIDLMEIDQWEAQKSRFRKTTAKGAEVAVSIDRGTHIRDGDVLLWNAQAPSALVARIELRDVMVVHLDDLTSLAPQIAMRTCVELGHAMGNQHWPALTSRSSPGSNRVAVDDGMFRRNPKAAARSNSSARLTSKKWKCDPTCIGRSPALRTLSVVTGRSASNVIAAELHT